MKTSETSGRRGSVCASRAATRAIAWQTVGVVVALLVVLSAGSQSADAQFAAIGNDNMMQITKEQLVQNVFRNQRSLDNARDSAENALDVEIEFVALVGTLSDDQRAKLELAGRGDIERFFDDFESYLRTATVGQITMQQWNELWQELQPLQARYNAGLHGPRSLFRKTIPSALNEEQRAEYVRMEAERARRHYRALVKATLAIIDGKIPLTASQREQIIDAVMEKTRPPRSYGQSYYQYHIVLYQMSRIEDELKPIFEEKEWELMQKILGQGRMIENMLRRQGIELDAVDDANEPFK